MMIVYFVGGEIAVFFVWKMFRRDFLTWQRIEGIGGFAFAILDRALIKMVVDFTGMLLLRHPCVMGGIAFSVSMFWVSPSPIFQKVTSPAQNKNLHTRAHTRTHALKHAHTHI